MEIEDDIFAVFTIDSTGETYDLTVAKNINYENSLVENIYNNFKNIIKQDDKITDILTNSSSSDILGRLKWKVTEYEKVRILQIADKNKIVVVLIKSKLLWMRLSITYLVIILKKKKMMTYRKVCFDIIVLVNISLGTNSNTEIPKLNN